MSDVELLPLPEEEWNVRYGYTADTIQAYARANVLHHTTAQAAEIEALRADLEETMDGRDGEMRARLAAEEWAERLAEALKGARRVALLCGPLVREWQHPAANSLEAQVSNLVSKIDALLRAAKRRRLE